MRCDGFQSAFTRESQLRQFRRRLRHPHGQGRGDIQIVFRLGFVVQECGQGRADSHARDTQAERRDGELGVLLSESDADNPPPRVPGRAEAQGGRGFAPHDVAQGKEFECRLSGHRGLGG